MKFSYIVDLRNFHTPAGYERERKALESLSEANGYLVRVTVEKIENVRTDGMNKKFHAMCRELARMSGDGNESTVSYIKDMVKSMAVDYYGYPQQMDGSGSPVYDDDGRPVGVSSSLATAPQITMLMDALRLLAITNGYEWRYDNG